ncbi:thioester-containing protein 1 allele R1-like [Toxorhynchites rutilus septentrionalis]|uniref:thioester-containing protein 1 allele R1-like n=1 Tax=Toxorhynchites rutilus septentrionalis TaxID=329112 RepID=UPI002478D9AC|nr:thioester-containing protein 1 allele R1-like [Toxorhynchites rutilus septentrionalis]
MSFDDREPSTNLKTTTDESSSTGILETILNSQTTSAFPSQATEVTAVETITIPNCSSSSLSVVGSLSIRWNTPYTVVLANPGDHAIQLNVSLVGTLEEKTVFDKGSLIIAPKNTAVNISFETFELPFGKYRLSFTGTDGDCNFNETIDLVYNHKTMSVFVQADKPFYSPGDRMRFRILIVDAHTRPVTHIKTINIKMLDATRNTIMQWPNAVIENGVFSFDTQLASSPVLGTWTLEVLSNGTTTIENFEVIQDKLPKFSVKVYPTKTPLMKEKKIPITIEAAHTLGPKIIGTARVELFLSEEYFTPLDTITTRINGQVHLEFTLNNEISIQNKSTNFHLVNVKVSVTEQFTNRSVNIIRSIPVFLYPYRISLVDPLPPLHPGMPYPVQIMVKNHYDEAPVDHKILNVTVRYEGNDTSTSKTSKHSLDRHGLVSLYLDPPLTIHRLTLEVNYDSVDYGRIGTVEVTESHSSHYVRVTLNPAYRVRVNKEVTFSISSTKKLTMIWYVIMSRGCIAIAKSLVIPKRKKYHFKVELTSEMTPISRLVVFSTIENILLFDQLELDFESFNNNVMMSLDSDEYQPGQDIYITVGAAQDSQIIMQAIDQSIVVSGNSANSFDKNRVLKDLALYDYTEDDETSMFPPVLIRTNFPKSWLWKSFPMHGKKTSVNDTVPDTITSWQISGFALSPTVGLGFINQPKTMVVKQPFYIIANLPYSVKRNEVTLIEVTLYNYLEKNLQTDVKLFNKKDEFEFVDEPSNATTTRSRKVVVVLNNIEKTIVFMIKAKKLGDVTIKIEAKNLLASDAVEHILRVTPESHLYTKTEARFIELARPGRKKFTIDIDVPRGIDDPSLQIKFTLDANFLGTTIKHLESLVHLPTGCGETNMVNFVPNIVILDYLSETGVMKRANKVKSKALHYLQNGYQNQLKFKRPDGSFSVWGRLDSDGCTFLTAFVAKSFKQASAYIDIDESIISNAFRWLADVQSPNGRFEELGQVYHANIQSGLRNNSIALTAYVLTSFLENPDISALHNFTVQRSLRFLSRRLDEIDDAYDLALTTYAFSLAGHPKSKQALEKLIEKSTFDEETGIRYWNRTTVGVEIAGYAILSLIDQEVIGGAMEIIHWLSQQRYGRGGYAGTQGTFVGLKALAKLSAVISTQKNDYKVTVWHNQTEKHTIYIDENDVFAIQEFELPNHVRQVDVEIDGIGHGVFQVAYQYHLNIKLARQSFNLNVNVLNQTTYHVQFLEICVDYIAKEAYQRSNLAMVEVFFPSGFVADENSVQELSHKHQIRKTELRFAATSVVVYYDSLGSDQSCFQVTAYRRYKVAEIHPANVVVYDYYDQDHFAIKSYLGKNAQFCDICEDEKCENACSVNE